VVAGGGLVAGLHLGGGEDLHRRQDSGCGQGRMCYALHLSLSEERVVKRWMLGAGRSKRVPVYAWRA